MIKRLLAACAFAIAAGPASAADAPYPSRPITIVLPGPPGGGADSVTRMLAEDLSTRLSQPVVVDNKPGASGIIGTSAAAKAPPDGYTLLMTVTQAALNNRFLFSKLPYDTTRDFAFITEVAGINMLLTVNAGLPVTNVKELLAYGGTHGLSFGNWGNGSYAHLISAYLAQTKKINVTPVAYKGEAPMLQDLAGGNIKVAISTLGTTQPFVQSGRVRIIGVAGRQRLPTLPNVPTLAEQGLNDPEYEVTSNFLLMAPIGTPPAIVARLEKEARAIIESPKFRGRMQALGFFALGGGAEQAKQHYDAMYPVQQRLVKISGAQLD